MILRDYGVMTWLYLVDWRMQIGYCERVRTCCFGINLLTIGLDFLLCKLDMVCGLAKRNECSSKITCQDTKIFPLDVSRLLKPQCILLKPMNTHIFEQK